MQDANFDVTRFPQPNDQQLQLRAYLAEGELKTCAWNAKPSSLFL